MIDSFDLDYETRSEADLKKVGAYEYAKHPSTEVTVVGYKIGAGPRQVFYPIFGDPIPSDLLFAFKTKRKKTAHNAYFEQVITEFVLRRQFPEIPHQPISTWKCTAAKARAHALPGNLEGAGMALGLKIQKDKEGYALIQKLCKPTAAWKRWKEGPKKIFKHDSIATGRTKVYGEEPQKWNEDRELYLRFGKYCFDDVGSESELDNRLCDLNETETKVWELDQKINMRGLHVDREAVELILQMIADETKRLKKDVDHLSLGLIESANQRAAILQWLKDEGVELENLQAKTVDDFLKSGKGSEDAKRMLEIRKAVSKTSTAKYQAFIQRLGADDRVRDLLIYHGASTGRWSGSGVQPQNFPKGLIGDTNLAIDIIKKGDIEDLRLYYGDPMTVFSSCLRGMITASEGKSFFCGDYSAIEARVLFWVAKHERGLEMYHNKEDLYLDLAFEIFDNKNLNKKDNPVERDLGKRGILGCGYGMGAAKFKATCEHYNQPVTEELAEKAVSVYREKHHPVPTLWKNLEKCAILAVKNKNKIYKINRTKWFYEKGFLWCELPSGRRLAYPGAKVKTENTWFGVNPKTKKWGPNHEQKVKWQNHEIRQTDKLSYLGVNGLNKKWERNTSWGGVLTENVVQAIARDLMAAAMLRMDAKGYDVVLSVHDELLTENEIGKGTLAEFEALMAELPAWAEGCPVAVDCWAGPRYKK